MTCLSSPSATALIGDSPMPGLCVTSGAHADRPSIAAASSETCSVFFIMALLQVGREGRAFVVHEDRHQLCRLGVARVFRKRMDDAERLEERSAGSESLD